jgi:large subunit ribosomal protein L13
MDTQSYKTLSANVTTVEKKWVVVDAEGKVLGRVASKVASLLRGKHKPNFTPHVDCGDNVIVINASKVRLTGNKLAQKEYVRFTGYPGGLRKVSAATMFKNNPDRMIENAVRGMLPKNSLGRSLFTNLRVYAGAEHPHEAQEPEMLEV